ncbi:MAG: aminotransferase class I/II-fold pyridoxal phosphate-dependent enzyme [bacterium]|nr:aminotransferase class I/II-fold pyridoxal phosphate-dependent enzyme [bacterium]
MSSPEDYILPRIRAMHGYTPGLQLNDPEIIKLNTNENPFPVSPAVHDAIDAALKNDRLHLYPEPRSFELRTAVARHYGLPVDRALIGNGSDEVLTILFRSLLEAGDEIVTAWPTYSLYPTLTEILGAKVAAIDVREDWQMDLPAMLEKMRDGNEAKATESKSHTANSGAEDAPRRPLAIITNPNAPTSLIEARESVLNFANENPALTLADEAYADFGDASVARHAGSEDYPRLLVCGTFSKTYSLAGGRVGWLLAHPAIIAELDKVRDSYNINRLTQTAALAALHDQEELRRRIAVIKDTRAYTIEELARLGFATLPGQANFIFTRPPANFAGGKNPDGSPAQSVGECCYQHLRERKILVRHFPGPRTGDFLRITIGTREQMERLVAVAAEFV